ncbi:MAG: Fic family protein [Candidatus Gracilibacteria bacterium]|jgi:cell filamentation protein
MAEPSRYNVSGDEEIGVLKNKLKIKDQKILGDTETLLLSDAYSHFFEILNGNKLNFTVRLIFEINEYFLSVLYDWAGKIREVEISKDGILFCPKSQINKALLKFEHILRENMPLPKDNKRVVSQKLAIIHCEFNAIHPFREGNGRTIRLFLDLIADNCGFQPINYGESTKETYIKACIEGMKQDYSKMQRIMYKGLSVR